MIRLLVPKGFPRGPSGRVVLAHGDRVHGGWADGDRKLLEVPAADGQFPPQLVGGRGERKMGEAADQGADGDLGLHPGERGAEAVVDAVAEREMLAASSGEVEAIGFGEPAR